MASRQYGNLFPQRSPGCQIRISETTATLCCGGLFIFQDPKGLVKSFFEQKDFDKPLRSQVGEKE
jgi:hypothetical protein